MSCRLYFSLSCNISNFNYHILCFLISYFKYYFINDLIFLLFKTFLFSIRDAIHDPICDPVHDLILLDTSFVDARCVGTVKP